jgi:hypothetical protein
MECNTLLESSQRELQLCFRPHPNWRSEQEVMALQSCRSLTLAILGLPFGSLGRKNNLDVGLAERHTKYYMGEGDGFPRVRAVVSLVNLKSPVACPNTKGVAT